MQENFSNLNQTHLDTLKEEGVLVLPDFISEKTINLIKKETSPFLETVSFNNRISSLIIGNNQWVEHVGICSLAATKAHASVELTSPATITNDGFIFAQTFSKAIIIFAV